MPHVLTEHPLPGIDPRRLRQLSAAGLDSLESVVTAGPERLMALTGFDRETCRTLIGVAEASLRVGAPGSLRVGAADSAGSLGRRDPDVIEFSTARDEPASVRLARGLKAARRVEGALSMVRKARSHAGRHPPRSRWEKPHRRARKQLRKLLERLEVLQQSVLSEGLSQASHDHLTGEIEALESALQEILDERIRKRTLTRIRRLARATREALSGRS